MKALGVMQGRLVPKYQDQYQAFPVDNWQKEFFIARQLGLDCIEFILDKVSLSVNPLLSQKGIKEIKSIISESGVKVFTVCADYFMDSPIFELDRVQQKHNLEVLKDLMHNVKTLGIEDIIIPCVDQSSLMMDSSRIKGLINALQELLYLAESLGVRLSLETDLTPKSFLDLIKTLNSPWIRINYDTGNSASLGYDVREEMETYGDFISTLHIKDRKKKSGSVVLGEGDADIDLALTLLYQHHFKGCIVLQAYRDDEGKAIFEKQLQWFKSILEKHDPHTVLRE